MAAKDQIPCNTDLLQASKFTLAFPRINATQFFCQAINIPGISTQSTIQTTPFSDLAIPGDKIVYETLDIEFLLDEELQSWLILHDWMKGIAFPEDYSQYRNLDKLSKYSGAVRYPQYADADLIILSASNNPKTKIHFVDAFPISLSGVPMDIRLDSSHTMTARASFRFKRYDINSV